MKVTGDPTYSTAKLRGFSYGSNFRALTAGKNPSVEKKT